MGGWWHNTVLLLMHLGVRARSAHMRCIRASGFAFCAVCGCAPCRTVGALCGFSILLFIMLIWHMPPFS